MNKTNLSLLNQQEIDILVDFLNKTKASVNSDVLNQESIDKLIRLIRRDDLSSITLDELESSSTQKDFLADVGIREEPSQVCELTFQIDPKTDFVILTATNIVTSKSYEISPSSLDHLEVFNSTLTWGYSIPPILFHKIAGIFKCKYSRQTYEDICALFALKNYGSMNQQLPSLYYPTAQQLLANLL